MYRDILFDLDGTLTDSSQGAFRCLDYAMERLGEPPIPPEVKKLFMGPPPEESFRILLGFSQEKARQALRFFREQYEASGQNQVAAIPGMAEALDRLCRAGLRLAVASSKDEPACHAVLENLGIRRYFAAVAGHRDDGAGTKAAIIRAALDRLGREETERGGVLMVGDRKYDVLGAATCGIPCLGVDFCGYAPAGEMAAAGVVALVRSPGEMADYILSAPSAGR